MQEASTKGVYFIDMMCSYARVGSRKKVMNAWYTSTTRSTEYVIWYLKKKTI